MTVGEVPVSELMREEVPTVREGDLIDDVLEDCSEQRVVDLVVVDAEGRFAGVVTSTEILNYINPLVGVRTGRKTLSHHLIMGRCPEVGRMMTRAHVTVAEDTTLSAALRHMRRDHLDYLVVVDGEERVVGSLRLCDVIIHLIEKGIIVPGACRL